MATFTAPTALLVSGPPGCGTTTIAGAYARSIARSGRKVLLLRQDVTATGEEELEAGCYTRGAGLEQIVDDSWGRGVGAAITDLAELEGLVAPQPSDLLELPLVTQLAQVSAVHTAVAEGRWDAVVIDAGPDPLASLSAPERFIVHLNRFLSIDARLARLVRAGAAGIVDPVISWLPGMNVLARHLAEATGPHALQSVLVTTPDQPALRRTQQAVAAHGLYQRPVAAIVVNKVIPGGGDPWRETLAATQRRAIDTFWSSLGTAVPPPCSEVGYDPSGELNVGACSVPDPVPVPRSAPTPTQGGYELRFPLPGVTREELSVRRRGDDLVLRLPHVVRDLPLPSGLRRCTITGARLRAGELTVSFSPDPALWREDEG